MTVGSLELSAVIEDVELLVAVEAVELSVAVEDCELSAVAEDCKMLTSVIAPVRALRMIWPISNCGSLILTIPGHSILKPEK